MLILHEFDWRVYLFRYLFLYFKLCSQYYLFCLVFFLFDILNTFAGGKLQAAVNAIMKVILMHGIDLFK